MVSLLTCGACGLVETARGTGYGPRCPRCGSQDIDAIELPRRQYPPVAFFVRVHLDVGNVGWVPVHPERQVIVSTGYAELGGAFVPRARAA